MLQLKNNTPFAAEILLLPNEQGIDTLYIIVKATFNIGEWSLADEQIPAIAADEYWAEPENSSIKANSDMHLGKLSTDILMLGNAFAPNGQAVQQLDVSLKVGQCQKSVRVFGDRHWQNGQISQPVPFDSMPMVYERAYGGTYTPSESGDTAKESTSAEEKNPVGLGFAGKRSRGECEGLLLPNLEDPRQLISSLKDQPTPACFAGSAPHWQPRINFAGSYDELWQTSRAPFLPEDFDKHFFNCAHDDMIYPSFLQGGEQVEISNMHAKGNLSFQLPFVKLNAQVNMAGRDYQPEFNLETLTLMPNQLTLNMQWRAALVCNKQSAKVKEIKVSLAR